MKKNNQGFMLVEFLVVSIFVLGTLIFLTIEFNNINKSYNRSFKYDTVSNLYAAKNIRKMLTSDNDYTSLKDALNNNTYVDFTSCPVDYFTSKSYCDALMNASDIKKALFVSQNLTSFRNSDYYRQTLNQGLRNYISTLKSSNNSSYMIILEFNDNSYASLKIN